MAKSGIKVTIRSGAGAGAEFWLTKRLTRVGSAAGCDILIQDPQTPAHAASLEQVNGRVVVHNRTDRPLLVDETPVAPSASGKWLHGSVLKLTPRLELELDCHATELETSPSEPLDEEPIESQSASALASGGTTAPAKSSSSNAFPIFFIVGCMGLIGFLVYFKVSGKADAGLKSNLKWRHVWDALSALPKPPEAESTAESHIELAMEELLRPRLQLLYRYQGLGDSEQFEKTQGDLLRMIDPAAEKAVAKAAKETSDQNQNENKKSSKVQVTLESLRDFVKSQKVGAR